MEIKHNLKCVFSSDVPWSQVEVVDWGHALAVCPCADCSGFISSEIKAGR